MKRIYPARMGMAACLLLLACGPTDHVEVGDRHFRLEQYAAAAESYARALEENPDRPRVVRQLGVSYARTGRVAEAYGTLERALELRHDTETAVFLGQLYLEGGRPEDADRLARGVLERDARSVEGLNLLGAVHMEAGRPAEARKTFQQMADLEPRNARGPYLVGVALRAEGRDAEARASYESALAMAPTYMAPILQLVELDRSAGRLDAAVGRVRDQIATLGQSAQLYTLLGALHAERDELELAESAFRSAINTDPRFVEAYMRLSQARQRSGDLPGALSIASDGLRADPGNPAMLLHLGFLFHQAEDFTQARQAYEQVLQRNPRSAAAANNLAWLITEQGGDAARALTLAEQARELAPDDPNVMDTLGWVYFKAGRHDEAVALLRSSAAQRPGHAGVHYRLGMAYAEAGRPAAARNALTVAANGHGEAKYRDAARMALGGLR